MKKTPPMERATKVLLPPQLTTLEVLESPHAKHPLSFAFAANPAAKLVKPLAVLSLPPGTVLAIPLAVFPLPPATVLVLALAVLNTPPATVLKLCPAAFELPPPM